ncbi:MAG TPA: putative toxin-antitoxin system toxin component, PIN family [Ramlibacter sp.]|nr:putative toxin-antitoxin system toxin component, PIN family [Ramlibacter sp.]HYD76706.1 putative toxin-antitoxin system toxin component, PIN family [Ramlibacter sp.]
MLDTNVVLDAFVFGDAAAQPLHQGLLAGRLQWLATAAMREELERVLAYPQLARRLAATGAAPGDVLAAFDRHAQPVPPAPRAGLVCRDPDDQKFIDLAVARRAGLLSKDRAVLALRKRLAAAGIRVAPTLD